jgi:hypothetical protein
MCCERYGGLMVLDACPNMDGNESGVWVGNGRCLKCGETIDSKIIQNQAQSLPVESTSSFSYPKGT